MNKTRLQLLAERHGDNSHSSIRPSMIDGVITQICELAEAAFGGEIIDRLERDILNTQGGYNISKSLSYLTETWFKNHLARQFFRIDQDISRNIRGLASIKENYVDYFVIVTEIERKSFRTELSKAVSGITNFITSYQTDNAYGVNDFIVNYFKQMKDPAGLEGIIRGLCAEIKDSYA